ncbi:MAG: potassium-transporting ATPase subunit KdpC [Chlamydiae bacterium]|nr:potassium-transporting ATPase subunit KdpC [Chlamydiota bacterium]
MKKKNLWINLRIFFLLVALTGLVYPLIITVFAQGLFHKKANGSLVMRGEKKVGCELFAQSFQSPGYFWPRPSSTNYSTLPAGGSNLGWTSAALKTIVLEREKKWSDVGGPIPTDLLFASGSGLDPHISVDAAYFQVKRVASFRSQREEDLIKLIHSIMEKRSLGFLGQPRVNVLLLNQALDDFIEGKQNVQRR